MKGKKLAAIISAAVLLAAGYAWQPKLGREEAVRPQPPPQEAAPAPQTVQPAVQSPTEAPAEEAMPARLELDQNGKGQTGQDAPAFAESQHKPKTGLQLTPGAVYEPGKGLKLDTGEKDTSIRIRKTDERRSGEYRVQWEKNF